MNLRFKYCNVEGSQKGGKSYLGWKESKVGRQYWESLGGFCKVQERQTVREEDVRMVKSDTARGF